MSDGDTIRTGGPAEDNALAAEYVLGLLDPAETEAFERRLAHEDDLVVAVAGWTEHFATLAAALEPVEPAPQVKRRLEALAFGEVPRQPWWRSLVPYAVGAVAAALLAWVVMNSDLLVPADPTPTFVADLAAEEGPELLVHAGYLAESNEFLIRRDGGPVPEGRDNEMWLVPPDGPPISLGLVPREQGVIARQVLPERLIALLEGGTLAVSEEPLGGSPTGTPTEVRAVGPILRFSGA